MLAGRIALVARERILRIQRVHLMHVLVTHRLRQNRGRADRRLGRVAADDGAGRDGRAQPRKPRQAVAVDDELVRAAVHGKHRAAHGEEGRMQDVERVDFRRLRPADPEAKRAAANLDGQVRAGFRR